MKWKETECERGCDSVRQRYARGNVRVIDRKRLEGKRRGIIFVSQPDPIQLRSSPSLRKREKQSKEKRE